MAKFRDKYLDLNVIKYTASISYFSRKHKYIEYMIHV